MHPLRVESVAWIADRKDVLIGVFFMLMLLAYVHYVRCPSVRRYLVVVFVLACGLMSKPMLVTMPFVLLLLDYWPLNRLAIPLEGKGSRFHMGRWLILEKLPLLALSLASCIITLFAQNEAIQPVSKTSLSMRLGNAVISCVEYLFQMLWPSNLAIFYPWEAVRINATSLLFSATLLLGISVFVFVLRRRGYFVSGWLWYLVTLGLVIGILKVRTQAHADRYTYLPRVGLYVLITWATADLCSRWRRGSRL